MIAFAIAMRRALALLILLASCSSPSRRLVLGTTTSMEGSGLLAVVMREFEHDTAIELQPLVVGSGQALRLAGKGEVDVTITHDPVLEKEFVASGHAAMYRQFMWNDFVIVGPADDPARIRDSASASDAFRRIAETRARFCSRNDESGTHAKELALWKAANVARESNPNYMKLGQGMAQLLRTSSELRAYTLSDRSAFAQLEHSIDLQILYSGDPSLRNVYAITVVKGAPEEANAMRFAEWMLHGRGRGLIAAYRIRGNTAFHLLP
jgi:tungstate transport system substrate-binding protein